MLVLGISASSFAQPTNIENNYWQCSTRDVTHTKWTAQSAYQKIALNLSFAECKKTVRLQPPAKYPKQVVLNSLMV